MMTTVTGHLTQADGSEAFGQAVISWPPFSLYGMSVAGGMKTIEIVDGDIDVELYPVGPASPQGIYYTVRFELDQGPVYEEYWIVPDTQSATLEQVRVNFPIEPSIYISPSQLTGAGAAPGQILSWSGANWVGGWVSIQNVDPNYIRVETGTSGTDFNVTGSPVMLGSAVQLNLPDAGPSARGVVTTGDQTFAGDKTFTGDMTVEGTLTATIAGYVPISRTIANGTGITGGGDLSANRTLSVVPDTTQQRIRVYSSGVTVGTRANLNFVPGANVTLAVTDDPANNWVNIMIAAVGSGAASPSNYQVNGTLVGTRPTLNLIAGTNVTIAGLDNSGADRVDVTINATGGGSQTPWTSNIDAAGFALNSVGRIGVGKASDPNVPVSIAVAGGQTYGLHIIDTRTTAQAGLALTNNVGSYGIGAYGSAASAAFRSALVFISMADFVFANAATARMRISATTGRVLIGTDTDDGVNRLQVNGTVKSLTGGYVFPDNSTQTTAFVPANYVPSTRTISTGMGLTGGGDLSANRTLSVVNDSVTQRVIVSSAGATVGTRQQINFIQGTNTTLTVADDAANNRVNVTIAATGGSQTPWTQDINGGNFSLGNVSTIGIGTNASSGARVQILQNGMEALRISDNTLTEYGFITTIASADTLRIGYFTGSGYGWTELNGSISIPGHLTCSGAIDASSPSGSAGAIELREVGRVTNTQSDPVYAPRLAFHWGLVAQGSIALNSDGQFRFNVGTGPGALTGIWANVYNGLAIQADGAYPTANQLLRSDGAGYVRATWFNTTSGDNGTTAISRVYASNDDFIRYYTPSNFATAMGLLRSGQNTPGSWAVMSGGAAVDWTGYGLLIRENALAGAMGGNMAYAPRLTFFWNVLGAIASIGTDNSSAIRTFDSAGNLAPFAASSIAVSSGASLAGTAGVVISTYTRDPPLGCVNIRLLSDTQIALVVRTPTNLVRSVTFTLT